MYQLDIGAIVSLESLLKNGTGELEALGLNSCQVNAWNTDILTEENASALKGILGDSVTVSSLWVGWPGPKVWDFVDGPATLGLVPREFRYVRMEALKRGARFAKLLGITDITTHVGFLPENPSTTEYREVVIAIRDVASCCKSLGLYFNFETGQETPVTLVPGQSGNQSGSCQSAALRKGQSGGCGGCIWGSDPWSACQGRKVSDRWKASGSGNPGGGRQREFPAPFGSVDCPWLSGGPYH